MYLIPGEMRRLKNTAKNVGSQRSAFVIGREGPRDVRERAQKTASSIAETRAQRARDVPGRFYLFGTPTPLLFGRRLSPTPAPGTTPRAPRIGTEVAR